MPVHPTTLSSRESRSGTDWKIFQAAGERLSVIYDRIERIKSIKSFEEFEEYIEEEKSGLENHSDNEYETVSSQKESSESTDSTSDTEEEEEGKLKCKRKQLESIPEEEQESEPVKEDSEEDESPTTSGNENRSSSSGNSVHGNGSDIESGKEEDQNESSWESVSDSAEEDQTLDDYLRKKKPEAKGEPKTKKNSASFNSEDMRFLPYSSLRDCMMRNFVNEDHYKDHPYSNKEAVEATKYLDENLPLIQVLDVIKDIDKVLKVGELTPRMERIIEYKQEYPFAFGYEEERLGWCPWLCFKVEQLLNRFWSTQWPN